MPELEDELSLEQLDRIARTLQANRQELRKQIKKVNALREAKVAELEATRKFQGMSAAEKKAMAQVVSAAGAIKTEESFGKIGG